MVKLPRLRPKLIGMTAMTILGFGLGALAAAEPPAITSANNATFMTEEPGLFTVQATGSPAPTYSVSGGAFPSWATIDSTTGRISGRPLTVTGSPFAFTLQATNSAGTASQSFTLTVQAAPGVIAVVSGQGLHTLFLRADGSLWTMGNNDNGQLGDGTVVNRNAPIQLATGVVAMAAGGNHTLFLKADTSLWGVGNDWSSQLGDGAVTERHSPIQIQTGVIGVAAGSAHSLFIKADGSLWGMGENSGGQLGIGSAGAGPKTPVKIQDHVTAAEAGDGHSLFVKTDGTMWAMGINGYGQLGDGTNLYRVTPVQVMTDAVGVSAGPLSSMVLKSNATLWGMGSDYQGVLREVATPIQISSNVTSFSTGYVHSMFVKADHTVWAAGSSNHGEFGDGSSMFSQPTPIQVGSGVAVVSIGYLSSFFLKLDGSLWASGDNQWGQLGDGTTNSRFTAVRIASGAVSAPLAPSFVSATRGGTSAPVVVTWAPVIGATSFEVWRATSADSNAMTLLARNVPVPRYEDLTAQVGVTYYYWVKSANVAGPSGLSVPDVGYRIDPVVLTSQAGSRSAGAGGTTTFTVTATGMAPLSYQWRKDGVPIAAATLSSLTINPVGASDAGSYDVAVTNPAGPVISRAAVLTVLPNPLGFSSRLFIGSAGATAYFALEGAQTKHLLLRVVGPTLANFGVSNPLTDPQITLLDANGAVVASNDNWGSGPSVDWAALFNQVGASALNAGSADAALYATLPPGGYQVLVTGVGGATGTALLELFDTDTNSSSRVAYLGVRGAVSVAKGGLSAGLTMTNSASKRLLLRAVGPTLGDPAALADPQLQVLDGPTIYASNDNWIAGGFLALAAAQGGGFGLNAGSADAAILIDARVGSGTYTAMAPSTGSGGDVLLEIYDINASGIPALAPLIVVPPSSRSVSAGNNVSLRALGVGLAGATYQWRKNGIDLTGATASTLTFLGAMSDSGGYDVRAATARGTATSSAATVSVTPAILAGNQSSSPEYFAGSSVEITSSFTYPSNATGLSWSVTLPAGWSYVSGSGNADVSPVAGQTGTVTWTWTTLPPLRVIFTYAVKSSADSRGTKSLSATLTAQFPGGASQTVQVTPEPLTLNEFIWHTADTDRNFRISLLELTRVIELYNTRNGSTRTGCYAVATEATEDGFQADPARASSAVVTLAIYHSADSGRDGRLSLLELTRMIELYNCRSGTTRTGQYHVQAGTEDNFAPGP